MAGPRGSFTVPAGFRSEFRLRLTNLDNASLVESVGSWPTFVEAEAERGGFSDPDDLSLEVRVFHRYVPLAPDAASA